MIEAFMSQELKHMSEEEFRNEGFLQEVNRKFFHPLGLALALELGKDKDGDIRKYWGIIDCREDPEGMFFDQEILDPAKADRIESLLKSKLANRIATKECNDDGIQEINKK
jgi:hypothetical protein